MAVQDQVILWLDWPGAATLADQPLMIVKNRTQLSMTHTIRAILAKFGRFGLRILRRDWESLLSTVDGHGLARHKLLAGFRGPVRRCSSRSGLAIGPSAR